MTELNDELLVAYVDGQLATDQSKAIERVLEEDEVAAQRVASLRAANSHLETAFEAMLAGQPIPVPAAESEQAGQAPLHRRAITALRRSIAFAWVGAGCLIAGAAAGFVFYDRIAAEPFETAVAEPPPVAAQPAPSERPVAAAPVSVPATWADDMVRAHALLSPETFSFGLEGEGNMELTSLQISKTLGASLSVPDLSSANVVFQRAQMMQRDGKPFAQIAYLTESRDPLALYATLRSGQPEGMEEHEKDGMGYVTWAQGELALLLAGDLPDIQLRGLAEIIESQFAAGEPQAQDTGVPLNSTTVTETEQIEVGPADEPEAVGTGPQ